MTNVEIERMLLLLDKFAQEYTSAGIGRSRFTERIATAIDESPCSRTHLIFMVRMLKIAVELYEDFTPRTVRGDRA